MNYSKAGLFRSCYLKNQLFKTNKKEVVFVGRSNVGKSSLINKILNRKKLARVSNVPGKTISINFYSVDDIFFVDFPGYGFAKISKSKKKSWDSLAETYFTTKRKIFLAVLVLDVRRGMQNLDFEMIKYLISKKIYFIVVLNKVDKLKKSEVKEIFEETERNLSFLKNIEIVLFSSKTGKGVEELKNKIENYKEIFKV